MVEWFMDVTPEGALAWRRARFVYEAGRLRDVAAGVRVPPAWDQLDAAFRAGYARDVASYCEEEDPRPAPRLDPDVSEHHVHVALCEIARQWIGMP